MRHGAERTCGCHKLWLSAAEHYHQLLTRQISGLSVYEFPAAFSVLDLVLRVVDGAREDYEVKFSLLFLHEKVVFPDSCCTSHSSLCSFSLLFGPSSACLGLQISRFQRRRPLVDQLALHLTYVGLLLNYQEDEAMIRGILEDSGLFAEKHTRFEFTLEVRILKTKLSMYW